MTLQWAGIQRNANDIQVVVAEYPEREEVAGFLHKYRVARAGEQSGVVVNARWKYAPSRATRSMFGVST